MSDQAERAYRCPDEGDDRHVYAYHSTGVEGLGFIGICMICKAFDRADLDRQVAEAYRKGVQQCIDAAEDQMPFEHPDHRASIGRAIEQMVFLLTRGESSE